MAKEIVPQLGLNSYSCPHCGALAHQHWFHVFPDSFDRKARPGVVEREMIDKFIKNLAEDGDNRGRWEDLYRRFKKNEVTHEVLSHGSNSSWRMMNMFMAAVTHAKVTRCGSKTD